MNEETEPRKTRKDTKKRTGASEGRDLAELIYAEESYRIMGACFEVYRCMDPGFLEAVYQECLEIEFLERGIPFVAQHQLPLMYKRRTLRQLYKADFVCYDKIIIELKAVNQIIYDHRAQAIHYLRATGMKLGILVNFCSSPELEHERLVV